MPRSQVCAWEQFASAFTGPVCLFGRNSPNRTSSRIRRADADVAHIPAQTRQRGCKEMFAELSNYLDDELDDSLCQSSKNIWTDASRAWHFFPVWRNPSSSAGPRRTKCLTRAAPQNSAGPAIRVSNLMGIAARDRRGISLINKPFFLRIIPSISPVTNSDFLHLFVRYRENDTR